MFSLIAVICLIIAFALIPHGGYKHTKISTVGCWFGIAGIVFGAVALIALAFRLAYWMLEVLP